MTKPAWLIGILVASSCGTFRESPPAAAQSGGSPAPAQVERQQAPPVAPIVTAPPVTPPPANFRTEDEKNSIDIFRLTAPSTVFVTQKRIVANYYGATQEVPAGSGTGFIWDTQGHIVTNYHVIKGAQALTVTMEDQSVFQATVRGVEPRKDIAVLKLETVPDNLQPIRIQEGPAQLEVGQKTLAIGNPFGLDHTLTTGIVSALGREVQGIGGVTIRDMIQTDAAINPGNSGGPLLDSAGHLIGMNTMIFSQSGASAGIGFAVPASAIKRVVPQIIATGRAEQVGLGVQIDPAQRIERRLGLKGVVVLDVIAGTPAAKAGLRGLQQGPRGLALGDVLVAINEQRISNYDDLYNTLDTLKATDRVTVTVVRDGQSMKFELELILLK